MVEFNKNMSFAVGATVQVVSVERDLTNGRRVGIIITNTSTGGQKISVAIDGDAVVGSGIVLAPGGNWGDTMDGNYYPTQKRISVISDVAGGSIAVLERVGGL